MKRKRHMGVTLDEPLWELLRRYVYIAQHIRKHQSKTTMMGGRDVCLCSAVAELLREVLLRHADEINKQYDAVNRQRFRRITKRIDCLPFPFDLDAIAPKIPNDPRTSGAGSESPAGEGAGD